MCVFFQRKKWYGGGLLGSGKCNFWGDFLLTWQDSEVLISEWKNWRKYEFNIILKGRLGAYNLSVTKYPPQYVIFTRGQRKRFCFIKTWMRALQKQTDRRTYLTTTPGPAMIVTDGHVQTNIFNHHIRPRHDCHWWSCADIHI